MQRTLVWPWHGMITSETLTLPNGATRPAPNLSLLPTSAAGPGDNHKVVVEGVPPITEAEAALAPAGGQYWSGRALITAGRLYEQDVSWIYQSLDGTRWAVTMPIRNIQPATSTLRLTFKRFGDFTVAPLSVNLTQQFPVGLLSEDERKLYFADNGNDGTHAIRLHSVSTTGRTAIISWCISNQGSGLDTHARPYTYVKVSLTGSGLDIAAVYETLYDKTQVRHDDSPLIFEDYGFSEDPGSNLVETGREPFGDGGLESGVRIFYDFESTTTLEVMKGADLFPGPLSINRHQRWIPFIGFDGETPVPCTLTCVYQAERPMPSITAVTDEQRVILVYQDGHGAIENRGRYHLEGSTAAEGSLTMNLVYGEHRWSRAYPFSSQSVLNDFTSQDVLSDPVYTTAFFDGQQLTNLGTGRGTYGIVAYGELWADVGQYRPSVGIGMGLAADTTYFYVYSNNCLALATITDYPKHKFYGAMTPDGFVDPVGEHPEDYRTHYGSYHPFTGQLMLGSPKPVNWI